VIFVLPFILIQQGIWDVLSDKDACEVVRDELQRMTSLQEKQGAQGDEKTPGSDASKVVSATAAESAAKALVKYAFRKGSIDNLTVVVVLLNTN